MKFKCSIISIVMASFVSSPLFAIESLKAWDEYGMHLTAMHLDGNEKESKKHLDAARTALRSDQSPVAQFIAQDGRDSQDEQSDRLTKALKFVTGSKQEVYCRDVGLVKLKAFHNDFTTTDLTLKDNHRQKVQNYADVMDGSWTYELKTGYRPASKSDLWIVSASERSFRQKERRDHGDGATPDMGDYTANWDELGKRVKSSFSTHGEQLEPFPMYLATDFHAWGGNESLGRTIHFTVGYEDRKSDLVERVSGMSIPLTVSRKVSRHFQEYTVTSNSGLTHKYSNCMQVDYIISSTLLEHK
jgi:hypothetical protein